MRGIEAAFFGVTGQTPELRTAKSGKPWASVSVGVETGDVDDSGAAKLQWLRVAIFGDAAVKLAGTAKGTRVYIEGTLTMTQWNAADGEVKHGLNVAAWKCERVANIGKNRERKEHSEAPGTNSRPPASHCAGPAAPRPHSSTDGFDFDRGDRLPW